MASMYERACKVIPPMGVARYTKLGVVKGQGTYLYTDDGRKLLDFVMGIGANNVGHNHPLVVEAAKKQMENLIHAGHNVVYYESYLALAEELMKAIGCDSMIYFSNSGSEANDGAIKLAKYATERPAIITFLNAFHGRTMGAMALTASNSAYRKHYEGLMPSVYYARYPNLYRSVVPVDADGHCPSFYMDQFKDMFDTIVDPYSVAGIIMEPEQGEGGYVVPPQEFVQFMRELCDKYGIMLIFDEVQCGNGRTGKLYCQEHFGIKPDIFSTAKGIGAGFPLSAVIGKKSVMEKWLPGAHGGTFGGNPVSCAAGLASLKILLGGALENATKMGAYFKGQLLELQKKYPVIGDVRGLGLMLAIEMVKDGKAPDAELTGKVIEKALDKGLLLISCGTYHNAIRFIPPTTVSKEEIDEAMAILDSAFAECLS